MSDEEKVKNALQKIDEINKSKNDSDNKDKDKDKDKNKKDYHKIKAHESRLRDAQLIVNLKAENAELKKKLEKLEAQNAELEQENAELHGIKARSSTAATVRNP